MRFTEAQVQISTSTVGRACITIWFEGLDIEGRGDLGAADYEMGQLFAVGADKTRCQVDLFVEPLVKATPEDEPTEEVTATVE